MRKFKCICVFGGSNLGKDREFVTAASELGKTLAARKINIVYGGKCLGLKAGVAGSAIIGGSKVLGITVRKIDEGNNYPTIGNELKVSSMYDRLKNMLYNADAFIALPGGLGTLEGIINVASWANLNFHQKPIGLLNTNGFYNGLLSLLENVVKQNFIRQESHCIIVSAPNADELINLLQSNAPKPDPLMNQVEWNTKDKNKEGEPDTTLRL